MVHRPSLLNIQPLKVTKHYPKPNKLDRDFVMVRNLLLIHHIRDQNFYLRTDPLICQSIELRLVLLKLKSIILPIFPLFHIFFIRKIDWIDQLFPHLRQVCIQSNQIMRSDYVDEVVNPGKLYFDHFQNLLVVTLLRQQCSQALVTLVNILAFSIAFLRDQVVFRLVPLFRAP